MSGTSRGRSRIPCRRGCQAARRGCQHTNLPDFPKQNCMKLRKFWSMGGARRGHPRWIHYWSGCYHSTSKTPVRDKILKLIPAYASLIYQIPCLHPSEALVVGFFERFQKIVSNPTKRPFATLFWSDSIVFNENGVASIIPELSQRLNLTLGINGPLKIDRNSQISLSWRSFQYG